VNTDYIIPNIALQKLKFAKSTNQIAYVTSETGYGKTELVKEYMKNKQYTYISCADWGWEKDIIAECQKIVVIDDLHLIQQDEQKQQIHALSKRSDIWLVLISRSPVPSWLMSAYIGSAFIIINENDLMITHAKLRKYLKQYNMELSDSDINHLLMDTQGNILAINLVASHLKQGHSYDEVKEDAANKYCDYLINSVMLNWDNEVLEFLIQISCVDEFNIQLAEFVTGNQYISSVLKKAKETGSFITEEDETYIIRPIFLKALRILSEQEYSSAQNNEFAYNAGLYYETQDDVVKALAMYEKSGNTGRVKELLIRNSRRNPGNGHFYELKKYYLNLPQEEVEKSPILMAGMSMLYCMLMQKEESLYWYDRLKDYEKHAKGGDKREALCRLIYLDIALPYRDNADVLKMIKAIPSLLFDKGIRIQEFSITSNLPSTMNGGRDFCSWSKKDKELALTIGKIIERLCGRYGKGIINVALGESGYEKGADAYEVLTRLSRAQIEAENGGKLEIAFASVGVQVRLNICNANTQTALNILNSFEQKIIDGGAVQLLPNLNTFKCRIALYNADMNSVDKWLEEAPNEMKEFFTMERYRYLTKIRCYIALGEYLKAFALIEKMRYYAEIYKRTYIQIELGILSAIVKYRMGNEWKSDFIYALEQACEYHFVPIISEEGAAVVSLLDEVKKDIENNERIDRTWFETVRLQTKKMASKYPLYLKPEIADTSDFSETALKILYLQSEGFSLSEIADKLDMKINTVKYHIKQNYKKLGVSSKTDAVITAQRLNLI